MSSSSLDLFSLPQRILHKLFRAFLTDRLYAYTSLLRWDSVKPSITDPLTFNEKLRFLMLSYNPKKLNVYADKVKVKELISCIIGDQYIIPTFDVWKSLDDVTLTNLDSDCFIKCSNGSHLCFQWLSEYPLTLKELKSRVSPWFNNNYFNDGREISYKGIKPVVFVEKLLVNNSDYCDLRDYKFFCFNGIPRFVQVDCDRQTDHTRLFFDMDWNLMPFTLTYQRPSYHVIKPPNFAEMIDIVSKLSWMFPFVRVDLYDNGQIYFGELTMFPDGAVTRFFPERYNRIIGDFINLDLPSFI